MVFLLTWHGTLLCRHRHSGALVHRWVADTSEDIVPVALDLPIEGLSVGFGHHVRATLPELPAHAPGALQHLQLQWSADQRTVTFQADGVFLSADEGDRVTLSRTEALGWESFLPVAQSDLDALRQVLASAWLIRSSGRFVEQPTTWHYFNLRIGDLAVDLRYQVPFDLADWPHRLTLLRDGWRIEQVCQYRPLVYYAAFGSQAIIEQFATSVRSLIEFGRYRGQIGVLTDHRLADLAEFLPAEYLARLVIIPFQPGDRHGFMTARYLILEWPDAWLHQPVLYVDTDIVFDQDVTPMLHAIALSDRIAAPVELLSPLASSPAAGAALLQRDFCSPGQLCGFNSGTLGVPNLSAHAATLRLIRRIIANHSLQHGREVLPFADQEIANYVSFRYAHFDTALISRFVRPGGADADAADRCGLVHFWGVPGASARAEAMRDYLTRLRAPS